MKTIMKLFLVMLITFSTTALFSQALITNQVSPSPNEPDGSSILELRIDDTQPLGFLPPRVTMIRNGGNPVPAVEILNPADGLVIYNPGGGADAVDKGLWYYDGTQNRWIIYSKQGSVFSNSIDNYGELFENQPDGPGTTYQLSNAAWTGWTSASIGRASDQFDPNVSATGTTPATPANVDYLAIDASAVAADYSVNLSMVVKSVSSGIPFRAQLWVKEAGGATYEIYGAFVKHYFQTGDEYATLATSALIDLGPGDRVELRMKTDNANETVIVEGVNMRLTKIGELATAP